MKQRVGEEEVTMAKLLARGIRQWCSDDGERLRRSTVAAMASSVLRFGEAEQEVDSK